MGPGGNRFSALLLEPTNLRAREFLRSALERIHAVMAPANKSANPGAPAPAPHPWLPAQPAAAPAPAAPPARNPPPAASAAQAGPKKPAAAPKVAAAAQ